jgi:hypothetical protein
MKKFANNKLYICDLIVDGKVIKNQFLDWKTIQRFKSLSGVEVQNQRLAKEKKNEH